MEQTNWLIVIGAVLIAATVIAILMRVFLKLLKLLIFAVIILVIIGFVWTRLEQETKDAGPTATPSPRSRQRSG